VKLRAWDTKRKEMYYIEDLYFFEEEGIHEIEENGIAEGHHATYKITKNVGLKDKEGKDIYVGDVVLLEGETTEGFYRDDYYEVIINEFNMIPAIDSHIGQMQLYRYHRICKVMGNIYENPELLSE
jgi:uncharacterized phage protein (TIGR01671 family)